MSFRQRKSTWLGAPEQSRKRLEAIGVPEEALVSESVFIKYLTDGVAEEGGANLQELTADQFWQLFDVVNNWYDMGCINFTAFEQRRVESQGDQ